MQVTFFVQATAWDLDEDCGFVTLRVSKSKELQAIAVHIGSELVFDTPSPTPPVAQVLECPIPEKS